MIRSKICEIMYIGECFVIYSYYAYAGCCLILFEANNNKILCGIAPFLFILKSIKKCWKCKVCRDVEWYILRNLNHLWFFSAHMINESICINSILVFFANLSSFFLVALRRCLCFIFFMLYIPQRGKKNNHKKNNMYI